MKFVPLPSPYKEMRIWGTDSHGYSFVITEELEPGDIEWFGFTASWKNENFDMKPFGKQPANRIDGGPWKTFKEAEQACKDMLNKLRMKQ